MARIFNTPAAGLAGLAVQAGTYLSEREFAKCEGDKPLDGRRARRGHHATGGGNQWISDAADLPGRV
jgi:hypothetical protein